MTIKNVRGWHMYKSAPLLIFVMFMLTVIPNIMAVDSGIIPADADTRKITIIEKGDNIIYLPKIPLNKTLLYSFSIRGRDIENISVEVRYYDENGSLLFRSSPIYAGECHFDWENVTLKIVPFDNAKFFSVVLTVNGYGEMYLTNFTIEELEPQKIQRINIRNSKFEANILLNKTYAPGKDLIVEVYFMNNTKIERVYFGFGFYYHGIRLYLQKYYFTPEPNGITKGYAILKLPKALPPGKYTLNFYIAPEGGEIVRTTAFMTIKPTREWNIAIIILLSFIIFSALLLKSFWRELRSLYLEFSIGQKFVFFAILGLILSALLLISWTEYSANILATMVYYLLVIGILNEWVEYISPKWDNKIIRSLVSICLLMMIMLKTLEKISTMLFGVVILGVGIIVFGIYGLWIIFKYFREYHHKKEG